MSLFLFITLILLLTFSMILLIYGFSTPFVQAGFVFLYILIDGVYIGWKGFIVILIAAAAAELIEFFSGIKGTQKAGGSKRSAWGSVIGGFIGAGLGTPFFPIGPIAGSFLGTFAGALILEFTSSTGSVKALEVGIWATFTKIVGFCIKSSISVGIIFGTAGVGIIHMLAD